MHESTLAPHRELPHADDLLPGFDEPVIAAQRTFRTLIHALAHPGTVCALDPYATRTGVPQGLSAAMTASLLTLVDSDTPLWLPADVPEGVRNFLRFHCGCPIVTQPADARFVAAPSGFLAPALADCDQGDPAYPDRSTTLLIDVDAMRSDFASTSGVSMAFGTHTHSDTVTLQGPGIEHRQVLEVAGLPAVFWTQWRTNHRHFPLGVDVFLCSSLTVCGLSRTTRLED